MHRWIALDKFRLDRSAFLDQLPLFFIINYCKRQESSSVNPYNYDFGAYEL